MTGRMAVVQMDDLKLGPDWGNEARTDAAGACMLAANWLASAAHNRAALEVELSIAVVMPDGSRRAMSVRFPDEGVSA